MNVRIISQWLTFSLSIASLIMLITGMKMNIKWRWLLLLAACFVSIDMIFYFIVLVLDLRILGNDLSPFRSALQEGILFAIIRWLLTNGKNGGSFWRI